MCTVFANSFIHLFIHQGALRDKRGGDHVTEGPVGQGQGLVSVGHWHRLGECSLGQDC